MRVAGKGHPGVGGGAAGDLLMRVRVQKDPLFRREGQDLLLDVPISVSEAALGTRVEIPTVSGGQVVVTIPAGASSGLRLRIKGQGILFHATRQRGDMYVVVKLALPPNLTDEARDLFRQIDQLCPSNPRQGLW